MADYSGDSVRSPIKRQYTNTSNPDESTHTLAVDDDDCQSKGSYEMARDKRVAELEKMFMPVQQAADTLSVLPLSPFLLVAFFHWHGLQEFRCLLVPVGLHSVGFWVTMRGPRNFCNTSYRLERVVFCWRYASFCSNWGNCHFQAFVAVLCLPLPELKVEGAGVLFHSLFRWRTPLSCR